MEYRLASPTNESQSQPTSNLATGFKDIIHRVQTGAVERARSTDQLVRTHPYQTIGLALGLGLLAGLLAGRKWHS